LGVAKNVLNIYLNLDFLTFAEPLDQPPPFPWNQKNVPGPTFCLMPASCVKVPSSQACLVKQA
jgi:hypothetical protein